MEEKIKEIREQAITEIETAQNAGQLEILRVKYLGRKAAINEVMKNLPSLPEEQRPLIGKLANEIKNEIASKIKDKTESLKEKKKQPAKDIDITLPGITNPIGSKHPITQVIDEISQIFLRLGFRVVEGPEIEKDYYNFQALNIPLDHPSRDTFHTFYLENDILLRSQTSTVQIRVMEKQKPPLKIIAPGKVFRPDATDASHSYMFHQIEGFMVDKDVSFSHLKGALEFFVREFFGPDVKMRFRPHFFPFTEPSAEVDISCVICGRWQKAEVRSQKRCSVCGGKGWLEVLGAGMINPAVFKAVGYDAKKYTGFAFGMGVERMAMLKYGIDDIRIFFENDLRFLKQF